MAKTLKVRCPRCKTEFLYHDSEWRPFCSEKCRLIDLGQWLNGTYAVPAQNLTEEEKATLENVLAPPDEDQ